eukprot:gene40532-30015_t
MGVSGGKERGWGRMTMLICSVRGHGTPPATPPPDAPQAERAAKVDKLRKRWNLV